MDTAVEIYRQYNILRFVAVFVVIMIVLSFILGVVCLFKKRAPEAFFYPPDKDVYQLESRGITSTTAFTPPGLRPN